MKGDLLPDEDHIARYCSPTRVEEGLPAVAAFEIDKKHDYLSVNWLEYWGPSDVGSALGRIREDVDLKLSRDGVFAVLNVAVVTDTVERVTEKPSVVKHKPTGRSESHAGVYGYSQSDLEVAAELAMIVEAERVWPGLE